MDFLTPQEQAAIDAFKAEVLQRLGSQVVSFTLFGSRARGEGDEESDVDILVLLKEADSVSRRAVYELVADILLDYEIDISPLVLSQDHYEDMKKRERLLPLDIERDGRLL